MDRLSLVAALNNATVVAVEPQADLAKFVAMAANLNGYSNRIMVLHQAVSKSKGKSVMPCLLTCYNGRVSHEP